MVAPGSTARTTDCRPVRAVFYTSSDWQRLAQGLAADASPCATYVITIPALAAAGIYRVDDIRLVAGDRTLFCAEPSAATVVVGNTDVSGV